MRWAVRVCGFLVAILALGILGLTGWLTLAHPERLQLVSAAAARIVCSNVFIAGRDVDAIVRTDLVAIHPIFRLMKIDVSTVDQRVGASILGLFAERHAQYVEGRGCANAAKDEPGDRPRARPASLILANKTTALWPAGEQAQLSDNKRLQAVLNDPALQGPGMRAIVVVHDGRIIAETYGQGFTASTPLLGWSMTKAVTAALVGMAIKDGKLSLDQKNLFPQWAEDRRADISIADLMAMSGGLTWSEEHGNPSDVARMEFPVSDAAAFARDRALAAPPGTKFNYLSGASVLLTRLWQNAVGEAARSYPQERIFKPLGMTSAVFESDESGTFFGESFPLRQCA